MITTACRWSVPHAVIFYLARSAISVYFVSFSGRLFPQRCKLYGRISSTIFCSEVLFAFHCFHQGLFNDVRNGGNSGFFCICICLFQLGHEAVPQVKSDFLFHFLGDMEFLRPDHTVPNPLVNFETTGCLLSPFYCLQIKTLVDQNALPALPGFVRDGRGERSLYNFRVQRYCIFCI